MRVLTLAVLVMLATAQYAHAAQVVPEPASMTLVGVGAAAIGAVAWWRSRRKEPRIGGCGCAFPFSWSWSCCSRPCRPTYLEWRTLSQHLSRTSELERRPSGQRPGGIAAGSSPRLGLRVSHPV